MPNFINNSTIEIETLKLFRTINKFISRSLEEPGDLFQFESVPWTKVQILSLFKMELVRSCIDITLYANPDISNEIKIIPPNPPKTIAIQNPWTPINESKPDYLRRFFHPVHMPRLTRSGKLANWNGFPIFPQIHGHTPLQSSLMR